MLRVPASDGSTEIHARESGAGRTILIVPGGLDDGSTWMRVSDALAPSYRVVVLHRRMYRLDLPAGQGIPRDADDVVAVARAYGEKVLLVGHSSGAVVALEALVAAPKLFAGAVLYEPPLITDEGLGRTPDAIPRARLAIDAGRRARAMRIFFSEVVQMPLWLSALAAPIVARVPRFAPLVPRQIDDAEALAALGDRRAAYARIGLPVLLLGGAQSPANLLRRLDALAKVLPHAERLTMPRQGHGANVKAPGELARIIATQARSTLTPP